MNKLIKLIVVFSILLPLGLSAQEGTSTQNPSTEYPVLERKLKKSDEDMADPKKNITPKYWLSRAELMMDIYNVNKKYIEGQQKLTITFSFGKEKEILQEEKNGELYETYVYDRVNVIYKGGQLYNYVETKKIFETPLPEAKKSLEKAQEMDIEGKSKKKIKEAYTSLSELYSLNGGRAYFYDKDQKAAYENFVASLDINAKPIMENKIDTSLMYNTGLIASQLGMYDESINYFKMALDYKFPEPRIYAFLKQAYFEKGDTAAGLDYLQKGFELYPESQDIVIELINYYLVAGKSEEALNYIKIAQSKDPQNISLVFAEGTLYDKKGELAKAVEIYDKTIAMDPTFFNGYYNKAVLYYNRGQQLYKEADDAPNSEYKKLQAQGDEQFKFAREPMEKCMEILESKANPSAEDKETLSIVYETLKAIYYRLIKDDPSMQAKFNEIKAKLGQ